MNSKTAMAAQFTEITLEDMQRFFMRGFRALRPKQKVERGTHVYDLALSPHVRIRIWTTIPATRETVRDVGETVIKVQMTSAHTGKPLLGEVLKVKRVGGWRDNLQARIEDFMEKYDENESYWDTRAGGPSESKVEDSAPTTDRPAPATPSESGGVAPGNEPTDKQIRYVTFLLRDLNQDDWFNHRLHQRFKMDHVPGEDDLRRMDRRMVSLLIDVLKQSGFGRRFAEEADTSIDYSYNRTDE